MAKRSKGRRKRKPERAASTSLAAPESLPENNFCRFFSGVWGPIFLGAVAFLVYWPSLSSDFVYDARTEIFEEGFIPHLSNLPAVLSLKVLGMNLMLATRPGQLLYLMLIAAVCGKEPFGYHLCSNLLHAVNAALLFVLLRRLAAEEPSPVIGNNVLKTQLALAAATLIFALHPLATEAVAAVSYSSDLLVTFFTLLALVSATAFAPRSPSSALMAVVGTFAAFAAVTCKESGIAAVLLLITYWFLFRRKETKKPWLVFLGAAALTTTGFLAARFSCALPGTAPMPFLGGSLSQVFLIQPRLWIFMMGKIVWPLNLSADYTPGNIQNFPTAVAMTILVVILLLQVWLASKSRMGALGVATYWLGLATVSNFIPLFRVMADRFYYLSLAGVAIQLLALLLLTINSPITFWSILTLLLAALVPLTALTLDRESVFKNDYSLWSRTLQVSPSSVIAHGDLGVVLCQEGRWDEAIAQYRGALEINPHDPGARMNLGLAQEAQGNLTEALLCFRQFIELFPHEPNADYAHLWIWIIRTQQGQKTEASRELEDSLANHWNASPQDKTTKAASFLLGRLSEGEYLTAAKSSDPEKNQDQECEAWYYAGMVRLLAKDRATAMEYFRNCLATGKTGYSEYWLAQAELRLIPAP